MKSFIFFNYIKRTVVHAMRISARIRIEYIHILYYIYVFISGCLISKTFISKTYKLYRDRAD